MKELIISNLPTIIILLGVLSFLGYVYVSKNYKLLRVVAYKFVTEAEKKYGNGTGKIKYKSVVASLYEFLPPIARLFVSKELLDAIIEEVVQELKEQLEKEDIVL